MAWFSFLEYSEEATPASIMPPLKRVLNIDELDNPIFEGEIISLKLNGKKINTRLSSTLTEIEDDDSYIVVYEDSADDTFFVPVKSRVIEDILYFEVQEDILLDTETSRYYAVYYGLNNLKYLDQIGDNQYQSLSEIGIELVEEGTYFDLATEDTINAFYQASEESTKDFQLALYDNGNSWLDGKSLTTSAKGFGMFDGPSLNIIGSKGPDLGKFRIRITKVLEDNTFSKTVAIDWQEVDCFERENSTNQVLFSTTTDLDYERYFFEIETLSTKNSSSTSTSVIIHSYSFIPNYKIVLENEQLNPSIAFIRIGGIR